MKDEIVEMLNEDLAGEHAAVIQYLVHAYAMGEGEMACEIEAIAREEMRHFDWLAETIVGLGGVPTILRGAMRTGGETVAEWMSNDVQQEIDAVTLYEEHIKAIGDRKIKRLLQRILSDEKSHRGSFEHFVEKANRKGGKDLRGTRSDRTAKILDWGIEHEYTVILQYLLHSYLTTNEEAKEELQDQAVNEMQHLRWLSEELIGSGGTPRIEHTEVDRSRKTADMLRADIKVEKEVAAEYDRAAGEVDDPGLKTLLVRIRDHERYHADVFTDLLNEEAKGKD
jgi:bacterioferritin